MNESHYIGVHERGKERDKYKSNNKREIVVKINWSSNGGETGEMFRSCG